MSDWALFILACIAIKAFMAAVMVGISKYGKRRVFKVYKRFYGYQGMPTHEQVVLTTKDRREAIIAARNLTLAGRSQDGRIDFDGAVK